MKLKHALPRAAVEDVEYIPEGSGEAGWMIYLREGYSLDPMSDERSTFISSDRPAEALSLIVYRYRTK